MITHLIKMVIGRPELPELFQGILSISVMLTANMRLRASSQNVGLRERLSGYWFWFLASFDLALAVV